MLVIIWVVLMMFWLFFGCWWSYEPARPYGIGNTLIPWLCVLIIGIYVFWGAPVLPPVR